MTPVATLRCVRCDRALPEGDWGCLVCGGPALAAPPGATHAVVSDEIAAMAPRRQAAELLGRLSGAAPESLDSRLKSRAVLAAPLTLTTARAFVERLGKIPVRARVVEAASLRRSLARRLLSPLPLALCAAGGVTALAVHPLALAAALPIAAAAAMLRRGAALPLVIPPPVPAMPPRLDELLAMMESLEGEARELAVRIARGSFRLLARALREGLTVDPTLDYGMGAALAQVVTEGLAAAEQSAAGDATGTEGLARLARVVGEAQQRLEAAPTPALPAESAEERLIREARLARELLGTEP